MWRLFLWDTLKFKPTINQVF